MHTVQHLIQRKCENLERLFHNAGLFARRASPYRCGAAFTSFRTTTKGFNQTACAPMSSPESTLVRNSRTLTWLTSLPLNELNSPKAPRAGERHSSWPSPKTSKRVGLGLVCLSSSLRHTLTSRVWARRRGE